MESKQESFKLYFGKEGANDIRRVTLRSEKFEDVVQQLYKLYNKDSLYHCELRIQYEDEEGDKITVSTQHEWEEMWSTVGSKRPIKIFITEGPNPSTYFKDGPAPEIQVAFVKSQESEGSTSSNDKKEEVSVIESGKDENLDRIVAAVPESLKKLFPGGKILPYHLPEWLRDSGALIVKKVPGSPEEVDLEICVDALVNALDAESLKNIGTDKSVEDLEKARTFLETWLSIQPNNARALYNMACTESLLNNVGPAVEFLAMAVGAGFNNIKHIEEDDDLDSIRGSDGYALVITELKRIFGDDVTTATPSTDQPVPTEVINLSADEPQVQTEEPKMEQPQQPVEDKKEEKQVKEELKVESEEKVEEVKTEKKPVETRFVEQLRTLEGMGYDASLCAFLLDEYRGDIAKVLEYLFGQAQ